MGYLGLAESSFGTHGLAESKYKEKTSHFWPVLAESEVLDSRGSDWLVVVKTGQKGGKSRKKVIF